MEFEAEIKIPEDRVAILVGKRGKIKKKIEEKLGVKLEISREGDVRIFGNDSLSVFSAKNIVTAIGRGFNPEIALELLNESKILEIIPIEARNKNQLVRIRGRLIGKEGKAREMIENLTDTHVSIKGKTVSIIGEIENVEIAKKAVEMVINGAKHSSVFKFLENEKKRKEHLKMLEREEFGDIDAFLEDI